MHDKSKSSNQSKNALQKCGKTASKVLISCTVFSKGVSQKVSKLIEGNGSLLQEKILFVFVLISTIMNYTFLVVNIYTVKTESKSPFNKSMS